MIHVGHLLNARPRYVRRFARWLGVRVYPHGRHKALCWRVIDHLHPGAKLWRAR